MVDGAGPDGHLALGAGLDLGDDFEAVHGAGQQQPQRPEGQHASLPLAQHGVDGLFHLG